MRKTPPLQRFDAAVMAFISSRRALGRAIRLDDEAMGGEPSGMPAAAGKRPDAGDPVTALFGDSLGIVVGRSAPGQHAARVAGENLLGGLPRHALGDRRADRGLGDTPRRRSIDLGELFDGLHKGERGNLLAAERTRHQHAEHARLVQRADQVRRQFAP